MKKIAGSFFLITIGLILAGYAVLAPMLRIVGIRTIGVITDVRRQGGERPEMTRNQYNYGVGYYFLLPDGKRIEGGATIVGTSYNSGIPKGPAAVRYLKIFPRINLLEKHTRFSIGNVILFGVGGALIYLSLKRDKGKKKHK